METVDQKKTPKRGKRSPEYPIISLSEAIEKAKILWNNDKNNIMPEEAAFDHLGYKGRGGYAARIMSALKKYDLISWTKNDIKLTEDAVDLALSDPNSEECMEIVKKLALKPAIYERVINDNNGAIPSDATLKARLIKDYEFNADKVDDFIKTFRRTMEFAGLTGDTPLQRNTDSERTDPNVKLPARGGQTPPGGQKQPPEKNFIMNGTIFPILLSKKNQAAIAFGTLPIGKKDIETIKKWLELFEDSLTEDDEN